MTAKQVRVRPRASITHSYKTRLQEKIIGQKLYCLYGEDYSTMVSISEEIYTEKSSYNLHEVLYMCYGLASSLVTETTNSQIKFIDRAGVSAAELMIETATGLSQKRNAELSELRERQKGVEC